VLFVIDIMFAGKRSRIPVVTRFTQLLDALVQHELRAFFQAPRHEENDDGRKRREYEAALPADARQQQRRQTRRDQRADRPSTLHEAVDKALVAIQACIVGG
jgi:hypothetical protein